MSHTVASRSPRSSSVSKGKNEASDSGKRRVSVQEYPKPRIIEPSELDSQKLSTTHLTSTSIDDTIHYLSPVSQMSARTVHEGDHLYETSAFLHLLEEFGKDKGYSSSETSSIVCEDLEFQRTLAIVKPEAMKYQDVICRQVIDSGFSIIQTRTVHLTPEQVSEIYSQFYGSPVFPFMVVSMSVGPVLVLSLAARNAVAKWREIVGPDKSLREEWFYRRSMMIKYGLVSTMANALHAPSNLLEANKQNRYFYPKNVLDPIITEEGKVVDYCSLYVSPTLLNGLTHLVKMKPVDPVLFLAEWLLLNNPFQPRFPPEVALLET